MINWPSRGVWHLGRPCIEFGQDWDLFFGPKKNNEKKATLKAKSKCLWKARKCQAFYRFELRLFWCRCWCQRRLHWNCSCRNCGDDGGAPRRQWGWIRTGVSQDIGLQGVSRVAAKWKNLLCFVSWPCLQIPYHIWEDMLQKCMTYMYSVWFCSFGEEV